MPQPATLPEALAGQTIFVIGVDAPEAERKRLESIGVLPGVELSVMANAGGPILLAVGEARVAVERQLAGRVIIEQMTFTARPPA